MTTPTHKVAFLGTPRSGTQFMTQAMRECGLDIKHEALGRDGIACGFWAWSNTMQGVMPCAAKTMRRFDPSASFEHQFHLVRHPLGVMRTMPYVVRNPNTYGWWFKKLGFHVGDWRFWDPHYSSLRYWVETHKMLLHRQLPKIDITCIEKRWPLIAERLGLEDIPLPSANPRAINNDELPSKVTWEDLRIIHPLLAEEAYQLTFKLGMVP